MELISNVDESTIVAGGAERQDTWNEHRSDQALREFVMRKMVGHGDFDDDDLFGLTA